MGASTLVVSGSHLFAGGKTRNPLRGLFQQLGETSYFWVVAFSTGHNQHRAGSC